jgi:redox-sensitive bicupin YhaK (pirin superfamily)
VSNLDPQPAVAVVGGDAVDGPTWEPLEGRDVVLGGTRAHGTDDLTVSRTLPNRTRRMVGAWCFVDHFGPSNGDGMMVAPHPHTGLQTVTWLIEGAVLHRDSLANIQLIQPGQLNLMTAGHGIAHAEVSPAPGLLHGVQLWVALPSGARGIGPHFEHHADLPSLVDGGAQVRLLAGSLGGLTSPARVYTPLLGAEISVRTGAEITLPLDSEFEYAILPLTGSPTVDGQPIERGPLVYLGRGRDLLTVGTVGTAGRAGNVGAAGGAARALLLGGEPFTERIVMWWNFIARSHDEVAADREDWMAGRRFGTVIDYDGPALPAPPMPTTELIPRGRVRD